MSTRAYLLCFISLGTIIGFVILSAFIFTTINWYPGVYIVVVIGIVSFILSVCYIVYIEPFNIKKKSPYMFCPRCQIPVNDITRICPKCGNKV